MARDREAEDLRARDLARDRETEELRTLVLARDAETNELRSAWDDFLRKFQGGGGSGSNDA